VFFIICIALYVGEVRGLTINLVVIGLALLLLGNIFLQNIIINRILGIIFLLVSCYLLLAIFSDFANGKATIGYLVGLFLVLFSIAMSILLILGHEKKKQFAGTEQS
jgi:hypothetical protein